MYINGFLFFVFFFYLFAFHVVKFNKTAQSFFLVKKLYCRKYFKCIFLNKFSGEITRDREDINCKFK